MSMQSPVGTLDIKNATLRVGKLEVSNIQGVDTALNVTRANSVLIYDDQASTTTFTGTTSSAGVRDTVNGYLDVADGYVYWGQKLPNSWVMDFEMDIRSGTNAGSLNLNVFSSINTGSDGYSIVFDDNGDNIILKYDGATIATAAVSGLFTASENWQKVVINYERGMIAISLGGERKLYYQDIERETPYTTGEYINFSSASVDGRKIRDLKITNGSKWIYAGESNVVYTQGSVGVGVTDPTTALDVSGTVKATALEGDGSAITNISSANVGDFASNVTRIETLETDLGSNATRVSTLETDLGSNVTRIGTLETGNMTISGQKTFSGDVIFESNVHMQGDVFVANTVNMTVSDPIIELGSNNLNTGDLGIIMTRHGATNSNIAIVFDESADVLRMGYTLGGASDADITLDSNVLAVNVQGALTAASVSGDGSGLSSIQSSNVSDFASNVGRIATLETDLTSNVGRIGTLDTDLTSNVTRITNLESSDMTIGGEKTFSSNLQVGTANLFVDTTTSNVGVGTNTPAYTLDVVGDINLSGDFYQGGSIFVSSLWTSGNGSLYYDASNVGIGTNTANYELDVVGNVNATTLLANTAQIHSNLTVGSNVTIDDTASNVISVDGNIKADTFNVGDFVVVAAHGLDHVTNENNSTGDTIISTNGTTGLQTTANVVVGRDALVSGNVGIGTASSAFKLDVHGTANVGTLYSTLTYSNTSANIVAWNSSTNEIIDSGLEKGFTEHPVAAMTDYHTYVEGHGTYEASASSYDVNQVNSEPWRAFDYDIVSGAWRTYPFSNSTYLYTGPDVLVDAGGTRYNGPSLTIKIPYAIVLSSCLFRVWSTTFGYQTSPKVGYIFGSNNGVDWHKIFYTSDFGFQDAEDGYVKNVSVNATTPYTHYAFVCTEKNNSGSGTTMNLNEWRLFAEKPVTRMENVHISGDLSSETLQTGYIKWPRKSLKANESEGYVASASNVYNTSVTTAPYTAFNNYREVKSNGYADAFVGGNGDFTAGVANKSRTTGGDTFNHEWLQIQMPRAIKLSHFTLLQRVKNVDNDNDMPKNGRMYGSNDGVSWTKLVTFSNLTYERYEETRVEVKSTTPYSYYRLAVTETVGGSQVYVAVGELQLFEAATGVGAAPTSAKLQVAGSLGMAKGSEFFAGDDVVMELPKHDRPLVKYPEVAMTASSVGGYTVSEPTNTFHGNSSFRLWKAFNNDTGTPDWETSGGSYDTGTRDPQTSGSYAVTTVVSGTTYYGVYAQMLAPIGVKVSHVDIRPQNTYGLERLPGIAVFAGSDDGTEWTLIRSVTNNSGALNAYTRYSVNATQAYKYIRIIWNKLTTAGTTTSFRDRAAASEIKIFGTEEGDTSVDVVHRSIPNKPSQQQNIVLWDPNDPASFSLADSSNVYDLSGTGNTGIFGPGNASAKPVLYSSPEGWNAWSFSGNNDCTIETEYGSAVGVTGIHSLSMWFWRDPVNNFGAQLTLASIKDNTSGATDSTPHFTVASDGKIGYKFWGNDLTGQIVTPRGQWVHVAFTYDGGALRESRRIYINTVLDDLGTGGGINALNLPANSRFILGGYQDRTQCWDGYIAGVRLYSKVLSREQVLELYDYEAARFGHREDLVSVHKGNLGIGLRDPEQRLVVNPQTDVGYFPQTQVTHTGDFAYLHDNNSNARTFNVWTEKDGLLRVGCSTFFAGGSSNPLYPFQVFNTSSYRWQDSGAKYSTSNGSYTGSSSTTVDGTSRSGEYIEIVFGQPIQVEKFIMNVNLGGSFQNRGARTGVIAAKNYEDDSFTAVYELSGHAWNTNQDYEFFPSSSAPYRHYRFVIETLQGGTASDTATLTKWQFYGKYASTCNGAVLKTGGVVTGGVIAEAVSLGGKSSEAPLTVGKPAGGGAAMTSAASHWITNTGINSTTQRVVTEAHSGISIYALGNILTRQYLVSASGTLQSSDRRIKTNIADVNDSSALEAFRLIKPKLYNYTDVTRGSLPVWGFIAQEVGEVLNHSTQTRTEYIPNVYELANVFAEGTVLEFDTTKLQPGASELRLYDAGGAEQDVLIDEIVDEFTVRVSKPVDSRDRVFVFGQRVNDFTLLKKDAIWTTAAAALQQVDRELQAEKAKVKALERDARTTVRAVGAFEDVRDLIVNSSGARCALGEANAAFGIAASEGEGVCLARPGSETFLWVTDETGDRKLRVGDLVCLSDVGAGYAKRQGDDIVRASTVAKVLEACDFTQPHVSVKRVKTEEKDIVTYVKTLVVTREEYDALSENEREIETVTYYGKDAWQRVAFNEYVDKWPHYDHSKYFRTVETSVDDDVYENLPENERANYSRGEDGVWTYVSTTYIETGVWETLGEDEKATYELGFFKIVVEESETAEEGYDARTRDVYKKIVGTSGASKDGFEQRTTRKDVPVLDAFGQMQYEETSETEVAYAVRHLDASGARATRHDAVNTAARIRVKVV